MNLLSFVAQITAFDLQILLLPPQALVSGLGAEPDFASAVFHLPLLSVVIKLARNLHTLFPGLSVVL